VSALTDRNVILVKGKIVFEGSSSELRAQTGLMQQYLGI
jgi:branched-chain amino acid transport system ATP-binding protein